MPLSSDLAALKIDRVSPRRRLPLWPFLVGLVALGALMLPSALERYRGPKVTLTPVVRAVSLKSLADGHPDGGELSAAGYVVADRQAVLASKVTGRLKALLVKEAQVVKAGELVAEVEHHEIDAQLAQLRAQLLVEQAEVERQGKEAALAEEQVLAAQSPLNTIDAEIKEMEVMVADALRRLELERDLAAKNAREANVVEDRKTEAGAMRLRLEQAKRRRLATEALVAVAKRRAEATREAVPVARGRVEVARTAIAALEAGRTEYFIVAPFDGVVTEKAAEQGEIIAPVSVGGQLARGSIVTLADWQSLQAEVDVAEAYIGRVKAGQRARITVDALPGESFPGTVQRILPRANRSKATVQVRVGFFGERDRRILPDMGARVMFLPDDAPPGAERGALQAKRCLPRKAVQAGPCVWVVRDGLAYRLSVKLGEAEGDWVELLEGPEPGQLVVLEGAERLMEEGQRVEVP